jgi:hypothetical protein
MRKAPVLVPDCNGPEPAEHARRGDHYRRVPKNPLDLRSPSQGASATGRVRFRAVSPWCL